MTETTAQEPARAEADPDQLMSTGAAAQALHLPYWKVDRAGNRKDYPFVAVGRLRFVRRGDLPLVLAACQPKGK